MKNEDGIFFLLHLYDILFGISIKGVLMSKRYLKSTISITIATFLLAGCSSTQPSLTEDNSYTRTKTGAVAGALSGALLGYATGKNGKDKTNRVLTGALLGGVAGGAIGYSLDEQANEVARALGTGVDNDPLAVLDPRRDIIVSKTKEYVKIIFRDEMMFAVNSAQLQPSASYKVNKVAQLLHNYPQTVVGVAGFTDNQGSYEYNLDLSQARANTVGNILSVNASPATKGCSYSKSIAPNDTASNRALNRRVEVYLYGNSEAMHDPCM